MRFYAPRERKLWDRIEQIVIVSNDTLQAQGNLFEGEHNANKSTAAELNTNIGEYECEEEQYRISFTASKRLKAKLDRVKELLYAGYGSVDLETVLDRVLDVYLDKKCPEARQKKRQAAKMASLRKEATKLNEEQRKKDDKRAEKESARYVSVGLRDEVLERDGYCCTFVGSDGVRCEARTSLEADHVQPFALGGKTVLSNLRVLCKAHNLYYAREAFPDLDIERMISQLKAACEAAKANMY